ncbi:MAG: phosphonate C-P lyase system protein PhnL [Pseudomonadales bacterium]|nr:phosphonate C-P lyase system protein PhnL [Pseudomonadales bacterium]
MQDERVRVEGLGKTFTLYNQGETPTEIPVFQDLALTVRAGQCVVLAGVSGVGKSTLIRTIYGNYTPSRGNVHVAHRGAMVNLLEVNPRTLLDIRRESLGYVSQFLRVIPRISTLKLVLTPLLELGVEEDEAEARAVRLLRQLRLPERLWSLPPATFSGGEQQRVNIARSFVSERPILLLDEPTASLDAANRETVVELIRESLAAGVAMLGIFHDLDVRDQVATELFEVEAFKAA